MERSSEPSPAPVAGTTAAPIEAAVVAPGGPAGGGPATYAMFQVDADALTGDGATLRGGLLLEIDEEMTLEIRAGERAVVRARARVIAHLSGPEPAIRVSFINLSDADRQRLANLAAS